MDWSDEYVRDAGESCPFDENVMECDEHLCFSSWGTHVVMENVFRGKLEWHFNDSLNLKKIVLINAIYIICVK